MKSKGMSKLMDIKYDWVTSKYYKDKQMNIWADEYIKNNYINFELIEKELQELIIQDKLIGLNSFNKYGVFEMLWSTVPNALVTSLINASKCK